MIREHLIEWRKNLTSKNYFEFFEEVQKLPEADRECAAALWTSNTRKSILPIIMAFYHLEFYRIQCNQKGIT